MTTINDVPVEQWFQPRTSIVIWMPSVRRKAALVGAPGFSQVGRKAHRAFSPGLFVREITPHRSGLHDAHVPFCWHMSIF
jgi:hypothetical protein